MKLYTEIFSITTSLVHLKNLVIYPFAILFFTGSLLLAAGCSLIMTSFTPDEVVEGIHQKALSDCKPLLAKLRITDSEFLKGSQRETVFLCDRIYSDNSCAILNIHYEFGVGDLFLFFRRTTLLFGDKWRYLGHIHKPYDYGTGSNRIVRYDENNLFFIIDVLVRGSGLYAIKETWYLLSGDNINEVLAYYAAGYVVGWGMPFDREFETEKLTEKKHKGKFIVDIKYSVKYTNAYPNKYAGLKELFSYERNVRFVFNPTSRSFDLDRSRSELTLRQIDGIFNDAEDGFLVNNYDQLVNMTLSRDEMKKKWLRGFLRKCRDSKEKRALLEMIK